MDSESRLSEMDESQLSNPPPSDSDSSDSDLDADEVHGSSADGEQQQQQQQEQQTQWLATTRARRSTAGNRMKSMLANEEPDSDMELLFAEDENDQGFSDAAEDASDVQMDSSSDDDDDDADGAGGGDELEGEKELERQAREKRAAQRKRKAQAAIPAKFRKRVRINATASEASTPTTPAPGSGPGPGLGPGSYTARPAAPAPRPRKKSERLSWLPSPADLPTRASSRETTRMSKEQLHQQMVEREERRLRQVALMQKKAARMEALKKPPMTQEDRLREAEVVEKRNSKSLNRWEVAERQREEERRAKLAALHQRTLKGPVITFWSGIGEARRAVVEEERPKKKRERGDKAKGKAADGAASKVDSSGKDDVSAKAAGQAGDDVRQDADSGAAASPSAGEPAAALPNPAQPSSAKAALTVPGAASQEAAAGDDAAGHAALESSQHPAPAASPPRIMAMPSAAPVSQSNTLNQFPPRRGSVQGNKSGKPSGVLAAPILAPPPTIAVDFSPSRNPKSNVLAPPITAPKTAGPALPTHQAQSREPVAPPPTTTARFLPPEDMIESDRGPGSENKTSPGPSEPGPHQAAAEANTTTTRNAIILRSFDENAIKDKSIQTQILFGRKMNKLTKPSSTPICAITNLPARYRDPKTGLPFHNAYAYREIQRLNRGEHHFSKILNAWVGSNTTAARGVPERFLNPDAPGRKAPDGADKAKAPQADAQDAVKQEEAQASPKPAAAGPSQDPAATSP